MFVHVDILAFRVKCILTTFDTGKLKKLIPGLFWFIRIPCTFVSPETAQQPGYGSSWCKWRSCLLVCCPCSIKPAQIIDQAVLHFRRMQNEIQGLTISGTNLQILIKRRKRNQAFDYTKHITNGGTWGQIFCIISQQFASVLGGSHLKWGSCMPAVTAINNPVS